MTDVKPHVKVEQHPNPTRRSYHVTREVMEGDERYGWGDSAYHSYGLFSKKKPSKFVTTLKDRLSAIPGVTGGSFSTYDIDIAIGDAFDWKDIGPIVLGEIVNAIFPETLGGTIEISARIGWSYYVRSRRMFDDDDDGHRVRYKDVASHEIFEVRDPQVLDVERLLDDSALTKVKMETQSELVEE